MNIHGRWLSVSHGYRAAARLGPARRTCCWGWVRRDAGWKQLVTLRGKRSTARGAVKKDRVAHRMTLTDGRGPASGLCRESAAAWHETPAKR